jgi:hypothetical protein
MSDSCMTPPEASRIARCRGRPRIRVGVYRHKARCPGDRSQASSALACCCRPTPGALRREHMPEKRTLERARRDQRHGKSPSTQAGEFVREEIDHVREGKHGARSTKQAIAIGLSKARRAGVDLKPPREGSTSVKTRKSAERAYARGHGAPVRAKSSAKRSRAMQSALKREGRGAASHRALVSQARSVASHRSATSRSASARRASTTKGPAARSAAARKAARTRASRTHA